MIVSVCIASRGRPQFLDQCLAALIATATRPDTVFSVALDSDDPILSDYTAKAPPPCVRLSIAEREDSLGAKYNRACEKVPADLYVLWADDMVITDPGWDATLVAAVNALPDRCGAVLFGNIPGVLLPGLAVTHSMVSAMGFFNQPYTPYWWHETWVLEIADMAECGIRANIAVKLLQDTKGASRGVREIRFWAELFDLMRPQRRAVAEAIVRKSGRSPEEKRRLLYQMDQKAALWSQSNSVLLDPQRAAQLEQHYSFDAPEDERYLRLKNKAISMLAGLTETAA